MSFYTVCLTLSLVLSVYSQDYLQSGIVGINDEGDNFIYNGKIQKHWVKTQLDSVKLKEAQVEPSENVLYGIEKDTGIIYKKNSFSEKFIYVTCCATAFTFIQNPTLNRLPEVAKVLLFDGKKMVVQKNFSERNARLFELDVDRDIRSVASVGDVIAMVTKEGDLYRLRIHEGKPLLIKVQLGSAFNFHSISSISSWISEDRFLATSNSSEVWYSTTALDVWEKFGNGRSCCVNNVFEVPFAESFAEPRFPFCSQTNLENVPSVFLEVCRVENSPFGIQIYSGKVMDNSPCVKYIDSLTLETTAQDLASDYKVAVKAAIASPTSKIGVAFNFMSATHFDYVYVDPSNRMNCYGMGHMTDSGPVDRTNLHTGCPGGPLHVGKEYVLEVSTIEGQVQVKLDGELIFTAYPYYENVAAGGLLLWPGDHRVTSYGIGVCYVPNENAYESTYEPLEAIKIPTKSSPMASTYGKGVTETTDPYVEPGDGVTESVRTTSPSPPYIPTSTPYFVDNNDFDNKIEGMGFDADGSKELLSQGILYRYFLFKEETGWTSANQECSKRGLDLLLIDDETQNERVTTLLKEHGVDQVWLGKFWIDEWVITLNDGTDIDWHNFRSRPQTSEHPKFATLGIDSFWDVVNSNGRFYYVCQQARDTLIDRESANEVRPLEQDPDDDSEIANSFEETVDHPPVVIKGPVNVTAKVGDSVTFKCTASSRPSPTVIIVKIDDESVILPDIGDSTRLDDDSQRVTTIVELDDVTKEDAGKYACIAQNQLGEASSSAWLIIEEEGVLEVRPTCYFWGDPHVQTFDRRHYDFPGRCTYLLSIDCEGSSFWIYGRMKECGGGGFTGPSLTALDSLTIFARPSVGNHTGIELQRGWVINIGAAKLRISEGMTARHGNLKIKRTPEHVIVTLPNDVRVQWDGLQMAVIELPPNFDKERTCGLCGRYNGISNDGFFVQNGPTDYTDDPIQFGNSWAYVDTYSYNGKCENVPLDPPDPCDVNSDRADEASMECYKYLYEVPFTSCHSSVDPILFFRNCKRDWCGSEWRRDQNLPLCNALSSYATACEKAGRPINSWRSAELCPIEEIKQITKEEGCPWDELEIDFDPNEGERDIKDP